MKKDSGNGNRLNLVSPCYQAVQFREIAEFHEALLISLRNFSAALADDWQTDLIAYTAANSVENWQFLDNAAKITACESIRRRATTEKRSLLLLDGWDEVPGHQRDGVKQLIQRELPHFVVVVTSRATGLPGTIFPTHRAKLFEIAGFSPASIREYVRSALKGKEARIEEVLTLLQSNSDLQGMASNPFLLSLLVQVLEHGHAHVDLDNRSEIYRSLVNWMIAQAKEVQKAGLQISGRHLTALENLAKAMMFGERSPRFAFTEDELERELTDASAALLAQSRFVLRIDMALPYWSFLHATFAVYAGRFGVSGGMRRVNNGPTDSAVARFCRQCGLSEPFNCTSTPIRPTRLAICLPA